MARGRFISRSVNTNARLEALPIEVADFFKRLIIQADVEGRLPGRAVSLKESLYELRDDVSPRRIQRWLTRLAESKDTETGLGLIEVYSANRRECIWLPGFEKHQVGLRKNRYAPSEVPEPPAELMAKVRKNLVAARGREPEKPKSAIKTDDIKVASMIKYYEEATGRTLGMADLQRVIEFADEYEDGWFEKAVDEVVASPEPINAPMPYIGKCLENWKAAGGVSKGRKKQAGATGGGDDDYEPV